MQSSGNCNYFNKSRSHMDTCRRTGGCIHRWTPIKHNESYCPCFACRWNHWWDCWNILNR